MAVLDLPEIVEVVLTHVDLQLPDVRLRCSDSKQTLSFHNIVVFAEVSRQEPEYEWWSIRWLASQTFKLAEFFAENVGGQLVLFLTTIGA